MASIILEYFETENFHLLLGEIRKTSKSLKEYTKFLCDNTDLFKRTSKVKKIRFYEFISDKESVLKIWGESNKLQLLEGMVKGLVSLPDADAKVTQSVDNSMIFGIKFVLMCITLLLQCRFLRVSSKSIP